MVLLQLTDPLDARLRSLELPTELAETLLSHLDHERDEAGGPDNQNDQMVLERPRKGHPSRTIDHSVLVRVARHCRTLKEQSPCTLASLLALTDVHAPPLPVREKSPELLAILAEIQLAQDRASYARMTQPATNKSSLFPSMESTMNDMTMGSAQEVATAGDWNEIRRQVSAIVNVIASMATVATGVWWVGGGRSTGARLGLAMSGAAAIAAIEAFLYYRFFTRRDRERRNSARKKSAVPTQRANTARSITEKRLQ